MPKSPGTVSVAVCCVPSGQGFSRDKPVTYAGRQYSAGAYAMLYLLRLSAFLPCINMFWFKHK